MEGYFNNLAAASINEKHVLEEMVKTMANLTKTNKVLSKKNSGLTHQLTVMQNCKCPSGPTGLKKPNPRGGHILDMEEVQVSLELTGRRRNFLSESRKSGITPLVVLR